MNAKKFDCVQMKNDIQQKLAREYKNLSPDKIEVRRARKIMSNPLLKKFVSEPSLSVAHGGKNSTVCLCVR
ncbi:MAG: hypothetical protein LC725_12690 [Lentisphaerae bacterium]|nr:hypothetical protein [Lentisphaerota bacterium]